MSPARPDAGNDESAYMPSFPWRWIALALMTAAIIAAAYRWNEQSKAQALRAGIVHLHRDSLAEAASEYRIFRDDLSARILRAAAEKPTGHTDRQLKISGLRASPGLYLRIPHASANSAGGVAAAAATATADVIPSCIGLAPLSARGLYEKGAFLLPEWIDQVMTTDSVLRLRVLDDELARRVKRDLPSVLASLRSRWFLLVLEHGPRASKPVDVFLWDLRERDPLLSARLQSQGVLMSARVRLDGAASGPKLDPSSAHRSGAHDCSIGSQIKQLAGTPAVTVPAHAAQ